MAGRIPETDIIEVRIALNERGVELISHVLGLPQNRVRSSRKEARWGRNGSFSLALTGSKRGLWFDFEVLEGGDLFDLIRLRVTGGGFYDNYLWARRWLGWSVNGPAPRDQKGAERRRQEAEKLAHAEAAETAERLRKIRYAQSLWNRSELLQGTIAEIYLTRTRYIPKKPWPEALRFNAVERALVVAATTDDGELVGIQIVRLTPDARKISGNGPKPVKQSFGSLAGAAIRLPGLTDAPLLLAEGPETGLSAWAATGYETWVALGRISDKLVLPKGRQIIILHDDDKPQAPSKDPTQRALTAWREGGLDVRSAWPWETRRQDGSDFNDLLNADGPEAVRSRIDLCTNPGPAEARNVFDLNTARQSLDTLVAAFMEAVLQGRSTKDDAHPVHALAVSLGVGKTEAALRHGIDLLKALRSACDKRVLVISVPEHRLGAEVVARFTKMAAGIGLTAAAWRGREAFRPYGKSDERMCSNLLVVREAQRFHANVEKEICEECPFASSCAYLAQQEQDADLWVISHQALFHKPPSPMTVRGVAAIIVDESPYASGLIGIEGNPIEIPLDALDPGFMPVPEGRFGQELTDIRQTLKSALKDEPDGPIRRQALAGYSILGTSSEEALRYEWRRKVDHGPWRERKANLTLKAMTTLWIAVHRFLSTRGPETSGQLTLGRTEDGARCLKVTGRDKIDFSWHVPTMLIDATFDEELVRPYWPMLEVKGKIEVNAPHMRVRQDVRRSFSKATFFATPKKDDTEADIQKKEARAAKVLRQLSAIIGKIDRQNGGETLVVSNKSVIEVLNLPPHIKRAHFNAVAGRDEWRDVRTIIIVGRTQPPPAAVERMTGALTGKASQCVPNWYPSSDAVRRLHDGRQVACKADNHPDDICERIRRRICEGEILQAIGRGRGVNRTAGNPLDIIVLTDVVLPIEVEEYAFDALNPSPRDEMLAIGGVAFDDPTAAHTAYPQLWPTIEAAKKDLQRRNTGTFWSKDLSTPKCPPDRVVEVIYRRVGAKRRKGRALVDLQLAPDPRAAIEAVLGELAFFESLDL